MPNSRKPARSARTKRAPARASRQEPVDAKGGETALREQLVALLRGGHAHATFEDVVADLPVELRGRRPHGLPFSPWMLLEHMRIAQWDILEFSRNPAHVSPEFPSGYWPTDPVPPSAGAWDASLARFHADRDALERLAADPETDLLTPFPHGTGQNLLREVLVAASHTSYHLGELVLVRRALGAWPG